jgi:hypothetical protein
MQIKQVKTDGLTGTVEDRDPWEPATRSACQQIPILLENCKFIILFTLFPQWNVSWTGLIHFTRSLTVLNDMF